MPAPAPCGAPGGLPDALRAAPRAASPGAQAACGAAAAAERARRRSAATTIQVAYRRRRGARQACAAEGPALRASAPAVGGGGGAEARARARDSQAGGEAATSEGTARRAEVEEEEDDDDRDEVSCRICRQGEEAGKLYCPCRCAGSIKWIHGSCLQHWLQRQGRHPRCELCGHSFEFVPVYAEHAPLRLTLADWAGALAASACAHACRLARVAGAGALWGVALPLLTVCGARGMYVGQAALPSGAVRRAVPFLLNVVLGELLSVAGIVFIYCVSALRGAAALGAPGAEAEAPAGAAAAAPPAGGAAPAGAPREHGADSREEAAAGVAAAAASPREAAPPPSVEDEGLADPEEEFWNIIGLQGGLWRPLLCMGVLLCSNVLGILVFLALPFFLGRLVVGLAPPLPSPGAAWALARAQGLAGASPPVVGSAAASRSLPAPGQHLLADAGLVVAGYVSLLASVPILIPSALLLCAALERSGARGAGRAAAARRSLAALGAALLARAWRLAAATWSRLEMLAAGLVLLVLLPCYVGHVVVCSLAGPVLHLSHHARASLTNANMLVALTMQLLVGYAHLWGVAFLEGCAAGLAGALAPRGAGQEPARAASSNFFVCAVCSHRRFFGSVEQPDGWGTGPLISAPRPAMKVALVHVALHTPLAVVLWHLPARLLDHLLGEALFPLNLASGAPWTGDVLDGPPRPLGRGEGPQPPAAQGLQPPGQGSLFTIEIVQLYVLVLQCLRILDAPRGTARLLTGGLRLVLRRLGGWRPAGGPPAEGPGPAAAGPSAEAPAAAAAAQASEASQGAEGPAPAGTAAAAAAPGRAAAPGGAAPAADAGRAGAPLRGAHAQIAGRALVLWQLLLAAGTLVGASWLTLLLALAVPVTVGRWLVRYTLVAGSPRASGDFLPLSLGVVMLSMAILAVVKAWEALRAVLAHAARLERRVPWRLLLCAASFVAIAATALVLIPLGLGMLTLRLLLPIKTPSVYHSPMVFLMTDCWSLGLVLCKVLSRLIHTGTVLHELHEEAVVIWTDAHGSLTGIFFDLRAHGRAWRGVIFPLLEVVVLYLVFPWAAANTLVRYVLPEHCLWVQAFLLMYCYHIVLAVRAWFVALPIARGWLATVRQSIFDAKYLVSTELQNFHPVEATAPS